jgi:hypothetical protein
MLASSPHQVATGDWWLLFTSGLVFFGIVWPQVVLVLVVGIALLRLCGPLVFWATVLVGHIVCTVIVYFGVWVAGAIDPRSVSVLSRSPDYGVSLVWCACLGAVTFVVWARPPRGGAWLRTVLLTLSLALIGGLTVFSVSLARFEHIVAYCSGTLVVRLMWSRPRSET